MQESSFKKGESNDHLVLGSLAVDASFLSVMPSQWDWVGKQRSRWEADLYICIGSSLYGG